MQIRATNEKWSKLSERDEDYIVTVIEGIFRNIRATWRLAMPRLKPNGIQESEDEAAMRAFATIKQKEKVSRRDKRRRQVCIIGQEASIY